MATEQSEIGGNGADRSLGSAINIAAELRRRILGGAHAPGERLPPERALAESFHASRGTVREALRSLEARGFVTRRVGSGTFVSYEPDTPVDDVAEITSPIELIEVRAAVEPQMVRVAVRNATPRDIAALDEALSQMEANADDSGSFSRWDEKFHLRLAEATHNPLMVDIYHRVNHVRSHAQWNSIKDKILSPDRISAYNGEHRELFEALAQRDVDRAVAIVNQHMGRARSDLLAGAAPLG